MIKLYGLAKLIRNLFVICTDFISEAKEIITFD